MVEALPSVVAAADALVRHLSAASRVVSETDGDVLGLWHETGRSPALRVECVDADIAATVRIAVDHGLPVTVWGGRRDVFGRNAGAGEVVIDLRCCRRVEVDPDARTVTVGGGAAVRDVLAALPAEYVTVTTSNPDVGLVGAGTGGGYGPLVPRYGLICDQLRSARLVLADGSAVWAATGQDEELLWGLRGGGPGFGVVAEATFAIHPLERVLHAIVTVPLAGAEDALRTVQELLDHEPEHLGILPLFTAEVGEPAALHLAVHWSGPRVRGERVVRALERRPGAAVAVQQWAPYAACFTSDEEALWPLGQRWSGRTTTIARLDAPVIEALVEGAHAMPDECSRLFLHDCHGAPTRVGPEATAFPLRRNHYVAMAAGFAASDDEPGHRRQQTWAQDVGRTLAPSALPGGYVNFLAPSDSDRVAEFYGEALPRLTVLKHRVDPGHVFGSATGVASLLGSPPQ
jgi:FAD/FMN-containing dehydrogenase